MLQFPAWKMTLVVVICLIGAIYATPNFLKTEINESWPNFAPGKRVSLGLDLQGGSYLLLRVDLDVVIKEYLEDPAKNYFTKNATATTQEQEKRFTKRR